MNRFCRNTPMDGRCYLKHQWLAQLIKSNTPPPDSIDKYDLKQYYIDRYILTGEGLDRVDMNDYNKYKAGHIPIYVMVADDIDTIPSYL